MRFARQSTIFRGPLDPAAVVGVLFLLVIFILLGSLLYTPGVLIKFDNSAVADAQTITITRDGNIVFAGITNKATDLERLRTEDFKNLAPDKPLRLQIESGADARLVEKVRDLFAIRLPVGNIKYLTGTDNPTIRVAVNFRGQCFFENRQVHDPELKAELRHRLEETSRASQKLTMVLEADDAADNAVVMRLFRLARDAGITECILAERPSIFAAPSALSRP